MFPNSAKRILNSCALCILLTWGASCSGESEENGTPSPPDAKAPNVEDAASGSNDLGKVPQLDTGSRFEADMRLPPDAAKRPDTTSRSDSGSSEDMHGASDQGDTSESPQGVPMFIAQGDIGRTTISCDEGVTWVANRSFDAEGHALVCGMVQDVTCFTSETGGCQYMRNGECHIVNDDDRCDCDHHPGAARGISWGDGWFVATFGWGPKGGLFRSQDGQSWEQVVEDTTFAGVVFGDGTFITGSRRPILSTDSGMTWTDGGEANIQTADGTRVGNPRRLGFADVMGGRLVLTGSTGDNKGVVVSADKGMTWARPNEISDACASGTKGIVGGNNAIVMVTGNGKACVSDDGGVTFTMHDIGAGTSAPVFDGQKFMAWSSSDAYTSTDGKIWTATPLVVTMLNDPQTKASVSIGVVAQNPDSGVIVASKTNWMQWYDKQEFYRSTDGVNWEVLPETNFVGSHRIREMTFGYAPAGTVCPTL